MTAKNKRRGSGGFVFPVRVISLGVLAMVGFVLYAWLQDRSNGLCVKVKALERRLEEVDKRYVVELSRWERMKSPANIERALERHGIQMVWPGQANIVRLSDPPSLGEALAVTASSSGAEVARLSRDSRRRAND